MSLRVTRLIGLARCQDLGRPGWRRFGVPVGGAFDRESYRIALALAKAPEGAAAVELALGEIELVAEEETGLAWAGAPVAADVDGVPISDCRLTLGRGQTLGLRALDAGARVYLVPAGGLATSGPLGSVSESALPHVIIPALRERLTRMSIKAQPRSLTHGPFRVVLGPQPGAEPLLETTWRMAVDSDRRGLRLDGPPLGLGPELTSEPTCVGAVQAPPGGTPIVLGPDGPTVGGYPKPLVVAAVDRDRLGQLRPGDSVRFVLIDREEARSLAAQALAELTARLARISGGGC